MRAPVSLARVMRGRKQRMLARRLAILEIAETSAPSSGRNLHANPSDRILAMVSAFDQGLAWVDQTCGDCSPPEAA